MLKAMDTAGSRTWRRAIQTGARTQTDTGLIQITVGHGLVTRISAGQPIGANVDVVYDIGPEYYNFCDVRFIGEPVLRDRIFPPVQNVTYITNTVNVTNITVQNNVVYNYGPDFNVVNTYSSRPIQRLTIQRETPTDLSAALKSGTLTKVQGNKLLVGAPPKIGAPPPTAKPPADKAKAAQPKSQPGR